MPWPVGTTRRFLILSLHMGWRTRIKCEIATATTDPLQIPATPDYFASSNGTKVALEPLRACPPSDAQLLLAFMRDFGNGEEVLGWQGVDPCGANWTGIFCDDRGNVLTMWVSKMAAQRGGGWDIPGLHPPLGVGFCRSMWSMMFRWWCGSANCAGCTNSQGSGAAAWRAPPLMHTPACCRAAICHPGNSRAPSPEKATLSLALCKR